MSVSQCNLQFHVRLGSNDHNNNGNNNYNNNLLLCVCTVPGWCSVQFSLSLEGRERLEKAYITVSIVTCSIVPKDARRNCQTDELMDTLKQESVEITPGVML